MLRSIKARTRSSFLQSHVKGHQDDIKRWCNMTYEERLNSTCDRMAKDAITRHILEVNERRLEALTGGKKYKPKYDKYRLPLEAACVYVEGVKQTTEVGKGLKHAIGRQEAKDFYAALFAVDKGVMPPEAFETVDWDALKLTLSSKPKMYNIWYSKQCSGWCGTGKKLLDWKQTDDSSCPNCNIWGEDAAHLMVCRNADRTKLLEEHISMIEEWMECHYTDPLISEMVVWYLRGRGRRKLLQYPGLPPSLKSLAQTQDRIGWRNFTEGKLAVQFRHIQRHFLFQEDTQLTADSWMKGLVGKLLAMTHAQWIFRCISKHHRTKGTKVLRANDNLLREIDRQLDMGVECVSEADKWMLEIDVVQLASFRWRQQDRQVPEQWS